MTTLSIIQERIAEETAQTSTGVLGRMIDWIINALDVYFVLAGKDFPAIHGAEEYHISDPCSCV